MATIRDVAKAAGVSIATVSNYINKTKPIGREKAEKIATAISQLGYVPNQMARTLRRRSGNHVGVILPNIQDQYYVQILQGIEQYFHARNYFVSLGISGDHAEQEKQYFHHFLENQAAGIICVSCMPKKQEFFKETVEKSGVPLVCLDRRIEGADVDLLRFDNQKTMFQLTQDYLNKNCRRLALLCGPEDFSCEKEAELGFREALGEATGAEFEVLHTALNKEAAFRVMLLYLQRAKPDAVLATSKPVAAGILESLMLVGLSPGTDVFVGALGEDNWTREHDRPDILYTARQAITMGIAAGEQLFEKIKHPQKPPKELVFEDVWRYRQQGTASVPVSKKVKQNKTLRVLMLNTQQVELFSGLMPHFVNQTGIQTEILRVGEHEILSHIAKRQADVTMFDMPWLYSLAQSGVLADISCYMQDFDESIYLHQCLEHYGKFNGKYYGLPFNYAPQMLFYRRDLFEDPVIGKQYFQQYNEGLRPPKTWSEFNRVAKFFDKKLNPSSPVTYGTVVPTAYKECLLPEVYMRMRAYGGEIYNSRFSVNFGTDKTVKALSSLADLCRETGAASKKMTDRDVAEAFLRGESAMQITYPSHLSDAVDVHRWLQRGMLGFAHVPGKCPILGGWSLGVLENSTQKDEAFSFIKWACGAYMANYSAILAGQSAISASFDNNELISLYPWLPLYRDMYPFSEPILPPHKPGREIIPQEAVDNLVAEGVYELLEQKKPPAEATAGIHQALEALFKKYRY
ncbi:MAG: extracellular solute-binding protein [Clostridia bacterium]|nr:extracellular solute-binding protein [Clostridia bacterium]